MPAVVPRVFSAARKAVYRIQWRVRIGFTPISPAVHGKQTCTATSRRQRFSCHRQYRRLAKRPSSGERERDLPQRTQRLTEAHRGWQSEALCLDGPFVLWYFSSIFAASPGAAGTLTTAYFSRYVPPAPHRSRSRSGLDGAGTRPNVAVFAIYLATSLPLRCHFVATSLPLLAAILPLLPPITRNVKLPISANQLELRMCEEVMPI